RNRNKIPKMPLETWDTIKPETQVTLYRGESEENTPQGEWWTTDRTKAERFGEVTSRTVSGEYIGQHAARGHGGADEFVFPTEEARPEPKAKATTTEELPIIDKSRKGPVWRPPDESKDSMLEYLVRHERGLDSKEAEAQGIDPADM